MNALRIWYRGLAARDQRVLRVGGIAAAAIIVATLLFALQRSVWAARAEVEQKRADVEWMQQAGPALAAAGPGPGVIEQIPQGRLLVLIDDTARESGLSKALVGSPLAPGGGIQVQMEGADFNVLTAWVSRLINQHGLAIEKASLTASATPGTVNASILLRSPGAAP